jgi:hypothetical protein
MAIGGSFTNAQKGLRLRYDKNFRGYVGWSKGVAAAMIDKVKWSGKQAVIPIRVGNSPARSASFSKAQTKSGTKFTKLENFVLSWMKDYGVARVEGLLMEAASDSEGQLFDDMCAQIDGGLDSIVHSFSQKIYRNGFGCKGVIASTTNVATANLVLDKREDAVLFEVGEDLVFSDSDHADALRGSGASLSILSITDDGSTATLVMSAALNTVTGTVVGDFIFADGDRQDSATPSMLCIPGFDAWLLTPSAGADFTAVDRSLDFRLAGVQINATAGQYLGANEEDLLIAAVTESGRFGGKPRLCFMNPTRYQNLISLGMTRFRPTTVKGPAGIGFSGVAVQTSYGEVEVFADPYCPVRRSYVIDRSTLKYYGIGNAEVPRFLNHDSAGNILRIADDDGVESRYGYYGTVGCNAPIKNAIIIHEAGA